MTAKKEQVRESEKRKQGRLDSIRHNIIDLWLDANILKHEPEERQ